MVISIRMPELRNYSVVFSVLLLSRRLIPSRLLSHRNYTKSKKRAAPTFEIRSLANGFFIHFCTLK